MSYMDCSDWSKCTLCGECLTRCPVLKMDKPAAATAIENLIAGKPAPEVFEKCTFCFNCNSYCPEGLRPHELILDRFMQQRKKIPQTLQYLMNGQPISLFSDLYERLDFHEKTILERWSQTPPPSEEIMYMGCIGRLSCYDIENSQILKDLPKYSPPETCCGELAYRLGSWQAYSDTIERTLSRFAELDIKRMVCYCGSCYNYLSNILPNVYGVELPFEVISLYDWLLQRLEKGLIRCEKPLQLKAAIHESCYVSELGPQFAATLRKLYRAAGMQCVELEHHGENNLSCGAVSALRTIYLPDSILKEQIKKYREVSASGTRHMALNCPGCFITLGFSNFMFGKKLHYMPEELLSAFGDTITKPLRSRMPQIIKSFVHRFPHLATAPAATELPRIQPGRRPEQVYRLNQAMQDKPFLRKVEKETGTELQD